MIGIISKVKIRIYLKFCCLIFNYLLNLNVFKIKIITKANPIAKNSALIPINDGKNKIKSKLIKEEIMKNRKVYFSQLILFKIEVEMPASPVGIIVQVASFK